LQLPLNKSSPTLITAASLEISWAKEVSEKRTKKTVVRDLAKLGKLCFIMMRLGIRFYSERTNLHPKPIISNLFYIRTIIFCEFKDGAKSPSNSYSI
jgi:hypothetical protein